MKKDVYVVFCTVPDADTAKALARLLVKERLAACCNVVPGLTSIYRWEGEIQEDQERLLIIKTTQRAYGDLEKRLKELHPYDVPEIIALPVEQGNSDYIKWVNENVQS